MANPRNSMSAAASILALSDALRQSKELTIKRVQESCDVGYAQARTYLKVLEDVQEPVQTRKSKIKPRVKVWFWEGRRE